MLFPVYRPSPAGRSGAWENRLAPLRGIADASVTPDPRKTAIVSTITTETTDQRTVHVDLRCQTWLDHSTSTSGRCGRGSKVTPTRPTGDHGAVTTPDAHHERDRPWLMRTYSGHSSATASNELYRTEPGQGPDRPVDRLRPAHPDRLRPRPPAGPGRGRQGRRARRPPRPHAAAARRHPAGRDEHVDDDQRHRGLAARPLRRQRRGAGRRPPRRCGAPPRTTSSRSTCRRGTYIFPPEPSRRLIVDMIAFCAAAHPEVEPDERLQLPPAGGRGDAGAGDRLRAGHRHRRARRRARLGPGRRRAVPRGGRLDLVLRQRRHPLRRGDLQDAGLHRAVGPAHASSATASPTPRPAASATACRSTRSGSPRPSPRTTCSASCSRCSASRCPRTPGPGRCSCRRGTRRSACPGPWDQQWSLRMQQVLAFETDLLEYDDIFDGSHVVEATDRRAASTRPQAELDDVLALGGAFEAIDELKGRLVALERRAHRGASSPASRSWSASTASPRPPTSPLGGDETILRVDPAVRGRDWSPTSSAWRADRDAGRGQARARRAAPGGRAPARTSCRPPSPSPTPAAPPASGPARCARSSASTGPRPAWPRPSASAALADDLRGRRRAGQGPARRAAPPPGGQARPRRPLQRRRADRRGGPRRRHGGHLPGHPPHPRADRGRRPATRTSTSIGLSILSGSHLELVPDVLAPGCARRRRRPGRRRRHHPRGRPAPRCSRPASPPSTPRRTSSWGP